MNHSEDTAKGHYRRHDTERETALVQNHLKKLWSGKVKNDNVVEKGACGSISQETVNVVEQIVGNSPSRSQIKANYDTIIKKVKTPASPEGLYRKMLKNRKKFSSDILPEELIPQKLKRYSIPQLEQMYQIFFSDHAFSAGSIRKGMKKISDPELKELEEKDIRSVLQQWRGKLKK